MKQVTQGLQTRTFTYDSLNRLTSSINPESGTVLYTYDNVGNLIQRTDNRQIVTTNTYDALNRILQTTYTNPAGTLGTPTVTYTYDSGANANGQLTSVATSGVSTTSYTSFDVMGRFQKSTQTTGGQTFPFSYDYNYAGGLISEVYPSGRKITIGYDAANRQSAVNGMMNNQNTTYISSAGYAPNGGLVSYFTNNGLLTLNQLYNMHQQVSYVAVAQGNKYQSQNYFAQTMDWGSSNNNGVRLYGKKEYISNNAALPSAPTFSQTFSYDGVNRLLSASDTGGWSQTYSYDAYGNMWMPATSNPLPSLSGAAPTTNIYNASNQDPNVKYDGAGNQTSLGSLTLSYDGENRQSQIKNLGGGTATLQYDGLGHRVVKSLPSQTTTYVYDGFGQLAAEYSSGATPTPPCTTCFLTYDYLGNVRMVTDAQAKIIARHDFAPFGQEITSGTAGRGTEWGSTTDVDMKFTGQIRDQELGEDFFNARYLAIALGRFNSPDPGNAGASLGSSQSWNGYGYALNNPLRFVDPTGRYCIYVGGDEGDTTDRHNYEDDENGGPSCAELFASDPQSTSVNASPDPIETVPAPGFFGPGQTIGGPAMPAENGKTCPAVPLAPSNANLDANLTDASSRNPVNGGVNPQSGSYVNPASTLSWFNNQVNYGGPWDYKVQGSQYEDFGNFNYGATGTAAGFDAGTLLRAAGYAQRHHPESQQFPGDPGNPASILLNSKGGKSPFGDNPQNQQIILLGIQYAKNGC